MSVEGSAGSEAPIAFTSDSAPAGLLPSANHMSPSSAPSHTWIWPMDSRKPTNDSGLHPQAFPSHSHLPPPRPPESPPCPTTSAPLSKLKSSRSRTGGRFVAAPDHDLPIYSPAHHSTQDSRFKKTKRPYSAEDVVSKRGTLPIAYPSNVLAKKLWTQLSAHFAKGEPSHTYGA